MEKHVLLATGAGRGIGAAVCRHFSTLGYEVLVHYRSSAESALRLVEEISKNCRALSFQADVSKPDQVEALFRFCKESFGRLDVLVNAASYSSSRGWKVEVEDIDWNEWQKTIEVDLKGTMLCSHAAHPIMKEQVSGAIINFSSSAALYGDVPTYLYTAAKAAIVGITRTLSRAYAPEVRVNCIAPGSVATDWIEKWKLTENDLKEITRETPLKRIAKPEEIAALIAYLASPEGSFITGQTLAVDGGILML